MRLCQLRLHSSIIRLIPDKTGAAASQKGMVLLQGLVALQGRVLHHMGLLGYDRTPFGCQKPIYQF